MLQDYIEHKFIRIMLQSINRKCTFVQVKQAIFYRFGHLPRFNSRYFERCPGGESPFKQAKVELNDITDMCLIYCI